ncbi:carbohydrate-binding module family 1 protein [Xylariaceae sp. FL1019]|nr:carbohydrate-binding module family 1 protein [Xylariaceae sp. FL1019]
MPGFQSSALLAALASATTVVAHGHVTNIVINGLSYQGYDPTTFPYETDPPTVVGWTASDTDNGFVAPDAYTSGDIICHISATNAGGHAQVAAGDSISIQWDTWPESHKGPMIDYLAACNGDCESADKTALEFFKIDEVGLLDSTTAPGTWGSDILIENNNTWLVQIPADLKAGNYVLRHETIALHSAGSENGAQNYPQCFNLEVTGSGTTVPEGVLGTELYTPTDAGIEINIYTTGISYVIPGPTLIAGVSASVEQVSSEITASASAIVGSGTATASSASAATTTSSPASAATTTSSSASVATTVSSAVSSVVTTTAAQDSTSASQAATSTAVQPTTTLITSTRIASSTTTAPTTAAVTSAPTSVTSASGVVGAQSLYGQCGGSNWTGPTACGEGSCTSYNPYYYQCVSA